ncbi:MAG: hypothetical protein R3E08_03490 [Thiotrichaceae bacterium]
MRCASVVDTTLCPLAQEVVLYPLVVFPLYPLPAPIRQIRYLADIPPHKMQLIAPRESFY